MKTRTLKMMALAMALTVAAGMPGMSVKACEHVNDGLAQCDKEHDGSGPLRDENGVAFGCWTPDEDSYSEPSYSEPSYEESSYDYSSSNDDSGSNSSESYDSYDGSDDSYDAGASYDSASASTDNSAAPTPAVSTGTKKSNVVCVPGCQKWRKGSKATEGQFTVTHCGIVKYQFQLIDKDGNAVSYKGADLAKDEAGLWYINITTDDTVDTTGWGVDTLKGSITYMPELGVTGVMLNGTVIASGT